MIRDYNNLSLLPEIIINLLILCNGFQTVQKKNAYKSYYLLIDLKEMYSEKYSDVCNLNVLNFINNSNEKIFKKFFEYKNYFYFKKV